MTKNSNQDRQPLGIPAGGQFAPNFNPEATLELPGDAVPKHTTRRDFFLARPKPRTPTSCRRCATVPMPLKSTPVSLP
jgi:hypothetical protein